MGPEERSRRPIMVWHGRTLASLPSARLTIASGSITSPRVRVSDLTGCGSGSFCRSADPVPHTCPTSECVPEFGLWLGRRIKRGCICSGLRCVECRCAKARKRAIEMCLGRLRGPHSYARSHSLSPCLVSCSQGVFNGTHAHYRQTFLRTAPPFSSRSRTPTHP